MILTVCGLTAGVLLWVRPWQGAPSRSALAPTPVFDTQWDPAQGLPQAPAPTGREPARAESAPARTQDPAVPRSLRQEPRRGRLLDPHGPAPGAKFSVGRDQFGWLPHLRALRADEFPRDRYEVQAERAGYVFFAVPEDEPPPEGALPVAVNLRTGHGAVITGRMKVKFRPGTADALARQFSLEPVQVFEHLRTGVFTAQMNDVRQLVRLADSLSADGRVIHAELELLDQTYAPK